MRRKFGSPEFAVYYDAATTKMMMPVDARLTVIAGTRRFVIRVDHRGHVLAYEFVDKTAYRSAYDKVTLPRRESDD